MAEVELMVKQDTGWRNIEGLLDPTKWSIPAGGYLRIRRVGSTVTIAARIKSVSTVAYRIFTLPTGFARANPYTPIGFVQVATAFYGIGNSTTQSDLEVDTSAFPANTNMSGEWKYETNTPFPLPAAYPGTPA